MIDWEFVREKQHGFENYSRRRKISREKRNNEKLKFIKEGK